MSIGELILHMTESRLPSALRSPHISPAHELTRVIDRIKENCPGETMIPYSASFEDKYHVAGVEAAEACAAAMDDAVKAASPEGLQAQRAATTAAQEAYLAACKEKHSVDKLQSAFKRIIRNGYSALHLHHFFTCGHDEVKCWTIRERTKAPQAAGTIHGDFETHFIKAEVRTGCCSSVTSTVIIFAF